MYVFFVYSGPIGSVFTTRHLPFQPLTRKTTKIAETQSIGTTNQPWSSMSSFRPGSVRSRHHTMTYLRGRQSTAWSYLIMQHSRIGRSATGRTVMYTNVTRLFLVPNGASTSTLSTLSLSEQRLSLMLLSWPCTTGAGSMAWRSKITVMGS